VKSTVLRDVTSYSPVEASHWFGGIYSLHFQGPAVSQASNQQEASIDLLPSCFLVLLFNPEKEDRAFLRNIGELHGITSHRTDLFMMCLPEYVSLNPGSQGDNMTFTSLFSHVQNWCLEKSLQILFQKDHVPRDKNVGYWKARVYMWLCCNISCGVLLCITKALLFSCISHLPSR
jgi:hypothetical protein